MVTISGFKVVKNYYDWELWRNQVFLGRFTRVEDMLQFCYDLNRYAPEDTPQMKLEWD